MRSIAPTAALRRFEYMEPPRQARMRLALGVGALTFVGMLLFALYYDQIGLTLGQIWLVVPNVPLVVGAAIAGWSRLTQLLRCAEDAPQTLRVRNSLSPHLPSVFVGGQPRLFGSRDPSGLDLPDAHAYTVLGAAKVRAKPRSTATTTDSGTRT